MERRIARLKSSTRVAPDASRVLYIGRIPHGFYEDQMRGFLSQFGTVTRLRISRNKKTGHSKHYGFVEFESPEVASVVAECMHNYLISGKLLQVRVMPAQDQHALMWKGANKRFFARWPRNRRKTVVRFNRKRTAEEAAELLERQLKREDEKREKLKAAGIDYDFVGLREKLERTRSWERSKEKEEKEEEEEEDEQEGAEDAAEEEAE